MSEHPEYRIASIADFLKVPEDRLTACLEEFEDWVCILRATDALIRTLAPDHPTDSPLVTEQSFTWVDDGARNITMRLDDADGERIVDAHYPEDGDPTVTVHRKEGADESH